MAIEFIGADTANSTLTNVVSAGSVDTFGSYVELTASTARESHLMTVQAVGKDASAARSSIIEIATGAASSETPLFEFHLPHTAVANGAKHHFMLPQTVSSSTRVAARVKSSQINTDVGVSLALSDDDSWGTSTEATLLGVSNSEGTTIDPGGTADTKGNWTEITSSSPHDIDYLIFFCGNNLNSVATAATWLIDIGTGAASSETAVVENIFQSIGSFEAEHPISYPIYVPITSGTRIAVRAQCSITDATDRLIDVTILGVNATAPSGGGGGSQGISQGLHTITNQVSA